MAQRQFTRECKTATTAPTVQTTSHRGPDVIVRQMAPWKAEGLAAKLLLSHHGTLPSHYLVTLYDEMYRRQGSSTLLTLCSWHPDRLARIPEKSDHHRYPILSAVITNWCQVNKRSQEKKKQCSTVKV
ncbi:cilia- and flagella-associated protein 107-like [Oncorhynchus keta]|uniref:cilia- and flagella-associated protein 107-like n=1 Tax=Oncorhynchus keta TaxID=8018 RepID=UPI00227C8B46|nr:cilia- and flagella-associated protein 107-like [Oncorhynchus keta]